MAATFVATSGAVTTGTSLKTIIDLATTSTNSAVLMALDIGFNGTVSTATPIQVDLVRFTTDGTGTAGTVQKLNGTEPDTASSTFKFNYTAEPTGKTTVASFYVHPQTSFSYQWPMGREFILTNSSFLGVQVTAGTSVSCIVNLTFLE